MLKNILPKNLSQWFFQISFICLMLFIPVSNVSAKTLDCRLTCPLGTCSCRIFPDGDTCPQGTHPETTCNLNCADSYLINCISDSIPTLTPTPIPTDCTDRGGTCQPGSAPCLNWPPVQSPQCAIQSDGSGPYRCCLPSVVTPTPTPTPVPSVSPLPEKPAIPKPIVPCLETEMRNPEFHSLRPYQASPCGDSPPVYFCNNDYIIEEDVSSRWDPSICDETTMICDVPDFIIGGDEGRNYVIVLHEADYPILGNTQNVINSQQPLEQLNAAQKMSEYVNWYLQGVTDKAEYGREVPDNYISFAGPTKKLVPMDFLNFRRLLVLHDAGVKGEYITDPMEHEGGNPIDPVTGLVKETFNHNQIALCLDGGKPIPCWDGTGDWVEGQGKAKGEKERLVKWWESRGSGPLTTFYDWTVTNYFLSFLTNPNKYVWGGSTPPFPWQFRDSVMYQKAFNEWRGYTCLIFPPANLTCFLRNQSELSKYIHYVPLGNSIDKNKKHMVDGVSAKAPGATIAEVIYYFIVQEPVLHYPHTESTVQVSKMLNYVHTPKPCDEDGNCHFVTGTGSNYEPTSCEFVDVRTNAGDDLTFNNLTSFLRIDPVMTRVTQIECTNKGEISQFVENCDNQKQDSCDLVGCNILVCGTCGTYPRYCGSWPQCEAVVSILIRTTPKIPYIDNIWKNTVVNKTSAFRKIFPQITTGSPVSCIKEIPGNTKVTYTTNDETNLVRIVGPGNQNPHTFPGAGEDATSTGELYFPHLGTIQEYFLHGIQTALRPLGYGWPIINGDTCSEIVCGDLPELPNGGNCSLKGTSIDNTGVNMPPSLTKILEAAAVTYQVPPNLISAIMYGEGAFNGGSYHGSGEPWSEENAKNWATCIPLPNCSSPETSVVPFISSYWASLAARIKPDLEKLYPEGLPAGRPDPCNLLDATYALASDLRFNQNGSGSFSGKSCYGIDLNAGGGGASYCPDWDACDYETAIRMWEFGSEYNSTYECATKLNSCATGGGGDANCPGGDSNPACERINNKLPQASHNGCVYTESRAPSSINCH